MDKTEFEMLLEVFQVWMKDNKVGTDAESWDDLIQRLCDYHDFHVSGDRRGLQDRNKKPIEDYLKFI